MKVELQYQEAHDPNAVMVFEANRREAQRIVMALQGMYSDLTADLRQKDFMTVKMPIQSLPKVRTYPGGASTDNMVLTEDNFNEGYALSLVHEAMALLHHVREQKQQHQRGEVPYEDAAFLHTEAGILAGLLFDIFEDHDMQTREDIDGFLEL
jgi:hypothetical protein